MQKSETKSFDKLQLLPRQGLTGTQKIICKNVVKEFGTPALWICYNIVYMYCWKLLSHDTKVGKILQEDYFCRKKHQEFSLSGSGNQKKLN